MEMFLSGAVMTCFLTAAVFFARFWTKTRDQLFILFSISFALLGVERIFLLLTPKEDEVRTYVYLVRLISFIIIIYAVIAKNRSSNS
jgi:hypothetical protein